MTWPDAITLYAFGVLIGAPLLGRVLRGATIPPPEQDPASRPWPTPPPSGSTCCPA